MAKMMMGQIDHARKRIAQLKKEKLGKPPVKPSILGGSDVMSAIRDGTIAVSGPRLKQAFDAFTNRVVGLTVIKTAGNYRNDYEDTYKIGEGTPETVQNALANIVYAAENEAEVDRWKAEVIAYDRLSAILDDRSSSVEDAIVLGDQHAALQALQEFAAFDPSTPLDTL